jgi:hypothetical protein
MVKTSRQYFSDKTRYYTYLQFLLPQRMKIHSDYDAEVCSRVRALYHFPLSTSLPNIHYLLVPCVLSPFTLVTHNLTSYLLCVNSHRPNGISWLQPYSVYTCTAVVQPRLQQRKQSWVFIRDRSASSMILVGPSRGYPVVSTRT